MATVHSSRLTALAALAALLVPAAAVAQDARLPSSNSRPASVSAGAPLLPHTSGPPLYEKNADDERAPASLVKLMTLYLGKEATERGRAGPDEPVQISHYAALTPKYRMGLRAGEWVPLHVLLEGVAIASANDAATALAERLAGDESVFVERMNAKARELGLAGTRFTNPHGLPDPNQRSTARDLAQLTVRLLEDYPASRTMLGGQTFVYNGRVYARHIPLFNDPWGVQALKTGFTQEAGYNLAASAWRGGEQVVMILLRARTPAAPFLDAQKPPPYALVQAGVPPPDERSHPGPRPPGPPPRAAAPPRRRFPAT